MATLQDIKRILNCADNPTGNYLRGATFSDAQANVDIRIGNVPQGGKQINSSQRYQDYVTVAVYSWRKFEINSFQPLGPWFRSQLKARNIDFVTTPANPEKHEGIVVYKSFTGDWSDNNSAVCRDLRNYISVLREILGSDAAVNQLIDYNSRNRAEINDYIRKRFENNMENANTNAETTHRYESTEADMNTEIKNLLSSNLQIILTGAPGTGKTYTAKQVAFAMTGDNPEASDHPHVESVQFHPGYDYSDFVIGMKPEIVDGANGNKAVSFDWHDGVFKTFADKAREAYDKTEDKENAPKFVFLIDEINRADLSRVFGELFSLLEEEYRYPKNQTGITLPNGKTFHIPANLYIIGTMNDIDRSVESMDFALRRRFAWYEVKAEQSQEIISKKVSDKNAAKNLTIAMQKLNAVLGGENLKLTNGTETDLRLGTAYQLGGAIFAKFEKCGGNFNALWNNHISNVLSEYLRGRRDREDILKELKGIFDKAVVDVSGRQPPEQNAGDISAPSDQPATPQP